MKPKYCCSYSARTVQKHWMYSYIYIYKREKKSTNRRQKKKKKKVANQNGIVYEQ